MAQFLTVELVFLIFVVFLGDVKIFDFGLATEYDVDHPDANAACRRLTGHTGTVRYMAPEVAQRQRYTESADVYSFGILLWQIMSLEEPYGHSTTPEVIERKVVYCGHRPHIDQTWPAPLCRILKDCFASSPRRPGMEEVCKVLKAEINKLVEKKLVEDDVPNSHRSAMSARYHNNIHV